MKTLFCDGDWVCWRVAFGRGGAGERATGMVENWMQRLGGTRAIVCFSDETRNYFRKVEYADYKRGSKDRPPQFAAAKAALTGRFLCREVPGLEADDLMSIGATSDRVEGEKLIVSSDKDIATCPGVTRYNPESNETVTYSPRAAYYKHMEMTLTGDSGDGFPGIYGIGPGRAKKLLGPNPDAWWGAVCDAYLKAGMTVAFALSMARCAKILTAKDYDFERKKVIPWVPPYGVLAEAVA